MIHDLLTSMTQNIKRSCLILTLQIWFSFLLLFSCQVVSNSLQPHGLQHTRLPCPSPSPRVCPSSCPLNQWCHPTIIPFSSCLQSLPESWSFPRSQFFTLGGQSIRASASVLPMNTQDWFPLGLTGLISLQFKGLSSIFSNTTVQKHQVFGAQPSLWSNSHITSNNTCRINEWINKWGKLDFLLALFSIFKKQKDAYPAGIPNCKNTKKIRQLFLLSTWLSTFPT